MLQSQITVGEYGQERLRKEVYALQSQYTNPSSLQIVLHSWIDKKMLHLLNTVLRRFVLMRFSQQGKTQEQSEVIKGLENLQSLQRFIKQELLPMMPEHAFDEYLTWLIILAPLMQAFLKGDIHTLQVWDKYIDEKRRNLYKKLQSSTDDPSSSPKLVTQKYHMAFTYLVDALIYGRDSLRLAKEYVRQVEGEIADHPKYQKLKSSLGYLQDLIEQASFVRPMRVKSRMLVVA